MEDRYNVINPVEPAFLKKFHTPSVKRIVEGVSTQLLASIATPPLLDNNWLIIVDNARCLYAIKSLHPEKNTLLVYARNNKDRETILEQLEDFDCKIIDNYKVDKNVIKVWIEQKLHCNWDTATYLYNRLGHRLSNIVTSVQQLENFPYVNRTIIKEYTEKLVSVSVYDVVAYVLGIGRRDYSEIVQWLYNFRNSFRWVKKQLCAELELYLKVFEYMASGQLTIVNYKEFVKICGDKTIRECNAWKIKKIIEAHDVLSSEFIYYLLIQIDSINNYQSGVIQIMTLAKIGGNNVRSM